MGYLRAGMYVLWLVIGAFMAALWSILKGRWLIMLDLPWRQFRRVAETTSVADDEFPASQQKLRQAYYRFIWFLGWAWVVSGMILGALVAPSLVEFAGLSDTSYSNALIIVTAVLAGFLVQFLGWTLVAFAGSLNVIVYFAILGLGYGAGRMFGTRWQVSPARVRGLSLVGELVGMLLPFVGVGYGLNRYFNLVGTDRGLVTTAFVGGLLVKTFVIPAIVGAFQSKAFKIFMNWLRGGKETKKVQ